MRACRNKIAARGRATVGIFILALGVALYYCRPILLPVFAAVVVGLTLAPVIKRAKGRGISPWVMSGGLVLFLLVAGSLIVTVLATPVAEWISRATVSFPEPGGPSSPRPDGSARIS